MRPKPATLAAAAATGTLMFTAPVLIPAITAAGIALAPLPLSPNPGDQCWNWHATAQDAAGQTMTCTHTPDSGHLMYWELGGPRDSG